MSNLYKPHLLVLPEDEADQQLANGIKLSLNINNRALIIDKPAKGWLNVVKKYTDQVIPEMRKYPSRIVVLLIDFDCKTKGDSPKNRFNQVRKSIPEDLKNRTFVLGTLSEPEDLKTEFKQGLEKIGESLAEECPDNRNQLWDNKRLKHNIPELERLLESVKPFLFSA